MPQFANIQKEIYDLKRSLDFALGVKCLARDWRFMVRKSWKIDEKKSSTDGFQFEQMFASAKSAQAAMLRELAHLNDRCDLNLEYSRDRLYYRDGIDYSYFGVRIKYNAFLMRQGRKVIVGVEDIRYENE